jgi:hypothetical protein
LSETPNPDEQKPKDQESKEQKPEEKPEEQTPSPEDELPEWVRNELKKVRGEAAGYRTRLRDAETKLQDAKTPEQVEQVLKDFATQREEAEKADRAATHALLVENVGLSAGLPKALHGRIQGSTREELEADAKALAELFGKSAKDSDELDPEELSGGLNPRKGGGRVGVDSDDPGEIVKALGGRRR